MASSSATGSAKSISESRAQALQALLDSLAPGAEVNDGQKLKPDQVRKISDKLGELLGEDSMPDIAQPNEKGEVVNEEGLPIIDIVEPVSATDSPTAVVSIPAPQDPDLIPLWALSPSEKARRRAERDRILDLLEEEERVQQENDEAEERERFKTELVQRKQAAEAEMDALKKAREMQKKMGKALLRNLAEVRGREEQEKHALEEAERQARDERRKLKPKKSVTFADLPPDHEHQPANSILIPPPFDWGDVAPATLQTSGEDSLLTRNQMDKGPMRMNVVERVSGLERGPKSPPPPTQGDSDDESEPGSPVPADSDEGEPIYLDHSGAENAPPPQSGEDSEESDFGVPEDSDPVEWDVDGYDFARHQREIALAYYEKRAAIGTEALAAMRNHDHTEEENEWNQPMVPLEATLASAPPKPPVSRFKASLASSSSLPSQSLGGSVLRASQSSTLKAAVKLAKLENGDLVGGEEGESDDEIEPAAKEMLEMFKRGDVVNVGPSLSPNPPETTPVSAVSTSTNESPRINTSAVTGSSSTPKPKPSKVSQFKMSLAEPSTPNLPSSPASSLSTPVSTVERSSPKFPSRSGTPIAVPTSAPRMQGSWQSVAAKRSIQMPGMIVDSPSFSASGIIPSPSFPDSADAEFLSPSSTVVGTPVNTNPSSLPSSPHSPPTPTAPLSASVLERRPVVTDVRESIPAAPRSGGSTPAKERKISRFRADRM